MHKRLPVAPILAVFLLIVSTVAIAFNRSDAVKRLQRATQVFKEIMSAPDKGIPEDLLDKCECVGIVPGLKKAGLGLGGKYGKGVLMCRKSDRSWTAPSFITIEGGSIGFQIGFTQIDVVMVMMNRKGVDKLIDDKFTLGADASAAAGPVGRQTSAQTNIRLDAEILTYSRAKGLFAGISLEGATLRQDKDDNSDFYGRDVDARKILLQGTVAMPPEARPLASALSWKSPKKM
ncbi:MAG TPA: lipid-binding SYLF domain-containing protein [Blastocatellia bacterium]|nr:lipid-binding SYLF domain-containing protein [Blastocatellia bacterium]